MATVNTMLTTNGLLLKQGIVVGLWRAQTMATTAANAYNVTQAHRLQHGEEIDVFADSSYRGVEKREKIKVQHPNVNWLIFIITGKRRGLANGTANLVTHFAPSNLYRILKRLLTMGGTRMSSPQISAGRPRLRS